MSTVNPLLRLLKASCLSGVLLSVAAFASVADPLLQRPFSKPGGSPDFLQTPNSPTVPNPLTFYSQEQIDYFLEVALGSEFGSQSNTIKKWNQDVQIQVYGSPSAADLAVLRSVIQEINKLQGSIRLQLVGVAKTQYSQTAVSNLEIHFAPESKFKRIEPNYQPTNLGFFWTFWNQNVIENARILISTTGVTPQERAHLIREELTQSLGLMKDSLKYRNSIFYQGWTNTNHYEPIDKSLVEMLYHPEIKPGMTKAEVLGVFQRINAQNIQN